MMLSPNAFTLDKCVCKEPIKEIKMVYMHNKDIAKCSTQLHSWTCIHHFGGYAGLDGSVVESVFNLLKVSKVSDPQNPDIATSPIA